MIKLRGKRQMNSRFSGGASDFLAFETSRPALGPFNLSFNGYRGVSQRVKWPGCERGHLPRLVPRLSLIVSIPPLLRMPLLRAQGKSNFTFTVY